MKTILIIDDHELITVSLKAFIDKNLNPVRIITLSDGNQSLQTIANEKPDIVLLDLNMPERDGWDILRDIKSNFPSTKVLIFSIDYSKETAIRTFRMKAEGFCHKGSEMIEVLTAIKKVLDGEKYVPADISGYLMDRYFENEFPKNRLADLTNRETQVLQYIVKGMSLQEISQIMRLSGKTVSTYKRSIYNKLNVNSEIELYKLCKYYGAFED